MTETTTEQDAVSALLDSTDHEQRQRLLPEAVTQARRMAEQARTAQQVRAQATDPDVVRLAAETGTLADVHEDFIARWEQAVVDDESWPQLVDDLTRLVRAWADVIQVVLPDDDTVIAEQRTNGHGDAGAVADRLRVVWHRHSLLDRWSTSDTPTQWVSWDDLVADYGPVTILGDDEDAEAAFG